MDIGIVGLGRMGGNMAERLRRGGHNVLGYDRAPEHRDVNSLEELVERLPAPRVVWVMVPAGDATTATLDALGKILSPGDVLIDGGNSRYTDSIAHGKSLAEVGIHFIDVGVSGGVWGLQNGYALMVGGPKEAVGIVQPIFDTLKPPQDGFVHAGPVGAGHFTKMVHNGIEYGMMQSYAEGWELLTATDVVTNVPDVIQSWRQGTVIRSWLLDLLARSLESDDDLSELRGYAADSGEGRWTVQAAVDHGVPMPVISASLFARFTSQQEDSPAMKVVAAMRNQFGGHAVEAVETKGADSPGADVQPPVEAEGGTRDPREVGRS